VSEEDVFRFARKLPRSCNVVCVRIPRRGPQNAAARGFAFAEIENCESRVVMRSLAYTMVLGSSFVHYFYCPPELLLAPTPRQSYCGRLPRQKWAPTPDIVGSRHAKSGRPPREVGAHARGGRPPRQKWAPAT
jgi:hypothetical protein